ncbi:uncharacterized protein APUU_12240A [Aspergillus puulaauensis]|uniref:Uncharacterized protein n=1 Tax=Aspergillus puulaauensis TaxID=1220207 RepID=A0A7R7XDG5_9EURO|nr:uncharacterized protein APUU_12240A [Aspergillus puulaauensis]BCS19412.1 hypothetical protein APUU_12240A [Aspergillus puulaauensis]
MTTCADNPAETHRLDAALEIEGSPASDTESGFQAWLYVVGAFLFIIPSFGFMQSIGTIQSYLYLNQLSSYSIGSVGWITGLYLLLSYFLNIQVDPLHLPLPRNVSSRVRHLRNRRSPAYPRDNGLVELHGRE